MQPRIIARILSLAVIACVPFACTRPPQASALLVELSGPQADFGGNAAAGAQLAVANGDIQAATRGSKLPGLTLLQADVAPSPAITAASLERDSIAGIGCTDSDVALAAVPVFAKAGKPFMIIGATDPTLPNRCGRNVFLACFGDDAQTHAAAIYAGKTFGKRGVIVFDSKYDYTRGLQRYFGDYFSKLRGSVVARVDIRDSGAAQAIKDLGSKDGVDFVYLAVEPDTLPDALARVRAALPGKPVMGGDALDCGFMDTAPPELTERVYFTTHAWFGTGATPEARAFADAYTNAYGKPPANGFAALGYDATMIMQMAVNNSGGPLNTTPAAVAKAIGKIQNYRGASGVISYANGPVPQKDVWIVRMAKGQRALATRIPAGDL